MPKVAEVVNITTKRSVGGKTDLSADELQKKIEDPAELSEASALVWLAFQEEAQKDGRESPLYGQPGYTIEKSLHATVSFLWPTLGGGDYRDDPASFRVRQAIGRYLKHSGNLVCQRRGNRTQKSLWWVRAEWSDAPPVYPTDDRKPVEEPETTTEEPQGAAASSAALHACPDCPAVFLSVKSLSSHKAMLKDRPHPQQQIPCTLCPVVVSDLLAIINHVSAHHRMQVIRLCRQCGRIFDTVEDREAHLVSQHPDRFKRPAKVEQAEPDLSPIEVIRQATELYADMCDEHDTLRKENAELRTSNAALSAEIQKYAAIKETLRGIKLD